MPGTWRGVHVQGVERADLGAPVAGGWHSIVVTAAEGSFALAVNGTAVGEIETNKKLVGRAALASYFGKAFFDNFALAPADE